MRILITGGTGFIGGRVAAYLRDAGHSVRVATRNPLAVTDWLPGTEVVHVSWENGKSLEGICAGIDAVVHAAGMNAQECAADPAAALAVNGLSTGRLLAAARASSVGRFIYVSSAHVYRSPLTGRITEGDCPRNPHPYATSHRAGEDAVLWPDEDQGPARIVLRLSNAFGRPQHRQVGCWTLVVNDLCRQVVETGRAVLRTSGTQLRDFVPISDVCRLIGQLLGQDVASPVVLNVGTGIPSSVLDMARLVTARCSEVLGFAPSLIVPECGTPMALPEPLDFRVDRLAALGYSPAVETTAEIDELLRFCKEAFPSNGG